MILTRVKIKLNKYADNLYFAVQSKQILFVFYVKQVLLM